MTTTSYALSKQLFHAGFESKTDTYKHGERVVQDPKYPSYDLEAILNALPPKISLGDAGYEYLVLDIDAGLIHYRRPCSFVVNPEMGEWRGVNESLTDTAARLLLKLRQNGMVNFEQDLC